MIRKERLTAKLEGEFVVFLIGMRINEPLKVHKWAPVFPAMGRMLRELYTKPELGFLHAETWFGRTTVLIQYWRSKEQLFAYAKNREAEHLPAWNEFYRAIGTDGSVGIWHETYVVTPGSYENIYINMPRFGLGKAADLQSASGPLDSAEGRLKP